MGNESDHHTNKGFNNYPFVETDAPKGAFRSLRNPSLLAGFLFLAILGDFRRKV